MKITVNDSTYRVEMDRKDLSDPDKIQAFSDVMLKAQDEYVEHVLKIAEELAVSESCASNIVYLRGRSRWTQELENELIRMDKEENTQPNIFEWPEE